MIRVEEVEEPPRFDREARQPGNAWLAANPDAKSENFPDLWSPFRKELATGFDHICGYCAMWTGDPSVDHYIAKESRDGRARTYEWSNYRYADRRMNSRKRLLNARVLDPYKVGSDWFEILLPKLEMVVIEERVPLEYRDDAYFTLKILRLGDQDEILEQRRRWYEMFTEGHVGLEFLRRHAPLIARAVKKRLSEIPHAALDDSRTWFDELLEGQCTLATVRNHAPHLATTIDAALARPDKRTVRTNIVRT